LALAGSLLNLCIHYPAGTGLVTTALDSVISMSKTLLMFGPTCLNAFENAMPQEDSIVGCWDGQLFEDDGNPTVHFVEQEESHAPSFDHIWDPNIEVALKQHLPPFADATESAVALMGHLVAILEEKNRLSLLQSLRPLLSSKNSSVRTNLALILLLASKEIAKSKQEIKSKNKTKKETERDKKTLPPPPSQETNNDASMRAMDEFVVALLADKDTRVMICAAEALGVMCKLSGPVYTAAELQSLSLLGQQPTASQELRLGCALAVGIIFRSVGGIGAAGQLANATKFLLKVISESKETRTLVTALHSLCCLVDAAGPSFPGKISALEGVLGVLQRDMDMGNGIDDGICTVHHVMRAVGETCNALIAAVGPELDTGGPMMRVFVIVDEELRRSSRFPLVQLESVRFYQRLILFAPHVVKPASVMALLQQQLGSKWLPVRQASLTCLRQLVQGMWQKDLGVDTLKLATRLFDMLDNETDSGLLREGELVLTTLLETLSPNSPAKWLSLLCGIVLTTHSTSKQSAVQTVQQPVQKDSKSSKKSSTKKEKKKSGPKLSFGRKGGKGKGGEEDDEGEGEGDEGEDGFQRENDEDLAGGMLGEDGGHDHGDMMEEEEEEEEGEGKEGEESEKERKKAAKVANMSIMSAEEAEAMEGPQNELVPRWRTKVFAMGCVHELLCIVHSLPDSAAHFDMELAAKSGSKPSSVYLVSSIAEMVKLVFFAATSSIDALRPRGVELMKDIVLYFGASRDPLAPPGHRLLELYEVQFTSALTRAFQNDAPPLATKWACDVLVELLSGAPASSSSPSCSICSPESVPSLTARLTDTVKTLRRLEFEQYSERAATLVKLAFLRALARLSIRVSKRSEQSPALSAIKSALESVHKPLVCLWLAFAQDYAIIGSVQPNKRRGWTGTFVGGPADEPHVLPLFAEAWPDILRALCLAAQEEDSDLFGRTQRDLVLGIATARDCPKLVEQSLSTEKGNTADNAREALSELFMSIALLAVPSGLDVVWAKELISLALDTAERTKGWISSSVGQKERISAQRGKLLGTLSVLAGRLAKAVPELGQSEETAIRLLAVAVSGGPMEERTEEAVLESMKSIAAVVSVLSEDVKQKVLPTAVSLFVSLLENKAFSSSNIPSTQAAGYIRDVLRSAENTETEFNHNLLRDTAISLSLQLKEKPCPCQVSCLSVSLVLLAAESPSTSLPEPVCRGVAACVSSQDIQTRKTALETTRAVLQLAVNSGGEGSSGEAARSLICFVGPELHKLLSENKTGKFDESQSGVLTDIVAVCLLAYRISSERARIGALGLVLPLLLSLLSPGCAAGTGQRALHETAFQGVMYFAAQCGDMFRGYLGQLSAEERQKVESTVRKAAEEAAIEQRRQEEAARRRQEEQERTA